MSGTKIMAQKPHLTPKTRKSMSRSTGGHYSSPPEYTSELFEPKFLRPRKTLEVF